MIVVAMGVSPDVWHILIVQDMMNVDLRLLLNEDVEALEFPSQTGWKSGTLGYNLLGCPGLLFLACGS